MDKEQSLGGIGSNPYARPMDAAWKRRFLADLAGRGQRPSGEACQLLRDEVSHGQTICQNPREAIVQPTPPYAHRHCSMERTGFPTAHAVLSLVPSAVRVVCIFLKLTDFHRPLLPVCGWHWEGSGDAGCNDERGKARKTCVAANGRQLSSASPIRNTPSCMRQFPTTIGYPLGVHPGARGGIRACLS